MRLLHLKERALKCSVVDGHNHQIALRKFPYKLLQLKNSGLELFTATTFCQFLILCIGDAAKSSSSKLHYFWFIKMMGFDFSPILHEVTEDSLPTEGSPNTLENSCHTKYLSTSVFCGRPPMSTWGTGHKPRERNCMMH
jgi:hypothetical protein